MKILHVNKPWFPVPTQGYGGIEKFLYDLIQAQVNQYDSVGLVVNHQSNIDGVLNYSNFDEALAGRGFDRRMEDAVSSQAIKVFQEHKFDLIHAHSIESILPLVSYLKIPTVFTHHCVPSQEFFAIWDTLSDVSMIQNVFISQSQQRSYERIHGEIVHYGVNVDEFQTEEPFRSEEYLVFVGAIMPEKGVKEAIEIAKMSGKKLIIAGTKKEKYPQYYHEVMKLIEKNPNVEFIGEVNNSQRNELVSKAKYFLFTSTWEEPFGRVLLESLSVGTPVLAFSKGSAVEILKDAPYSHTFEDITSMVEYLVKPSRAVHSEKIKKFVEDEFSTSRMAKGYEEIYRSLM